MYFVIAFSEKLLSTSEVAAQAGIHRDTLLRWLRQRLVAEPSRDRGQLFVKSRQRLMLSGACNKSTGTSGMRKRRI